ncbi:MAG: 3'(2'),5'-bisphosphate nucleotidase CysQ, partial [Gammaproteobacteria bacterium]
IVRAAGDVILGYYDGEVSASLKADRSPVTEADLAAHRTIVAALPEWDPTVPVVSEEGDIPPYEDRRQWRQFWLVDPLDGTKEFLKRNGEFTVNAALIEDGRPVLGAVYAPALDRLYLAGRGLGAWKREGGRPPVRLVSTPRSEGVPLVVVESRSHPSPELEEYLRTVSVARRVQIGSSLKFCLVAEGAADVYPRFGPTMEWDTAAGDCVYRVSGRDGERQSPLRYNTPQLRHERFVIGAHERFVIGA